MLWQIFLIVFIVWMLTIRWRNRGKRELSKILSNDLSTLPMLGMGHHFIGTDEDRMTAIQNFGIEGIRRGGLTHIWLGNRFFCICANAEDAEFVCKNVLEKDDILKFVRNLTGNGSIFAPVSIWRPRRKVLAPTFSLKNLNQFVTIFAEQSTVMINKLAEAADRGTFSVWKYMTSYTMDAVCQTTLGVKLGTQREPDHAFLNNFAKFSELAAARTLQPWLHSEFIYKLTPYYKSFMDSINGLIGYVSTIIKDKRQKIREKQAEPETHDENGTPHIRSFLELLIEASGGEKGYTDVELQEETMVMLLAGTDTSAVGGSFVAVMLSKYPEVQEKLYQEIRDVFGDFDRPITAEDLPRLKYLDAVVKETLRLYPPVSITARMTNKEVVLPSGLKLVPDCGIILHIWALHRNPKYWGDDADIFRPERFFDSPPTNPVAFMPFSYGPRNCLGYQYATMSMKTVTAALVRRYQILPAEGHNNTKPLRVKFDIMMKHVDNYKLQLVSRK